MTESLLMFHTTALTLYDIPFPNAYSHIITFSSLASLKYFNSHMLTLRREKAKGISALSAHLP